MKKFVIDRELSEVKGAVEKGSAVFLLFTSEELDRKAAAAELEEEFCHMPVLRDARVCKAEIRKECLCGTVVTPRLIRQDKKIAFSYLMTGGRLVICDDSGAINSLVRRLMREKCRVDGSTGRLFYEILEQLVGKDLHHLEELEDQMIQMEDAALKGELDNVNSKIMALYKEVIGWMKYYTQLDEMVCELEENKMGLFGNEEETFYHILEKRIGRLLNETAFAGALHPGAGAFSGGDRYPAEWDHENTYDRDDDIFAIVFAGGLVRNEFCRDEGAVVEIWI